MGRPRPRFRCPLNTDHLRTPTWTQACKMWSISTPRMHGTEKTGRQKRVISEMLCGNIN